MRAVAAHWERCGVRSRSLVRHGDTPLPWRGLIGAFEKSNKLLHLGEHLVKGYYLDFSKVMPEELERFLSALPSKFSLGVPYDYNGQRLKRIQVWDFIVLKAPTVLNELMLVIRYLLNGT